MFCCSGNCLLALIFVFLFFSCMVDCLFCSCVQVLDISLLLLLLWSLVRKNKISMNYGTPPHFGWADKLNFMLVAVAAQPTTRDRVAALFSPF